jgi:hypothetical protein
LENVALRIGAQLECPDADCAEEPQSADVSGGTCHVVSNVYDFGGHSKLLAKWISRDKKTRQIVVFTRPQPTLPEFFERIARENNTRLFFVGRHESVLRRAFCLRATAGTTDRLILHTHPDDVVPIVALATRTLPPVALFNHAHFWCCLGSTVADIYVNTFPYFENLSRTKRFARDTTLLHTAGSSLHRYGADVVDKAEAKQALGLPRDATVLLTMGNGKYYRPGFGYDFFRTSQRILDRFDNVKIVFAGLSKRDRMVPRRLKDHPRAMFCGWVTDPTTVYKAADLCLESFPMPSLAAVTQAAALGEAFPVLMYGDSESVVRVDRSMLFAGVTRARTESEYLKSISGLLADPAATRNAARRIREHIVALDARFADGLYSLYERIDNLAHAPDEIPPGIFDRSEDSLLLAAHSMPLVRRLKTFVRDGPAAIAGNLLQRFRGDK